MSFDLVLLSGNANKPLAKKISEYLAIEPGDLLVSEFADGETRVELFCNVRGKDIFIVQPTCFPVNHNIMETLLMVDACKRASAGRITLVAPYFGYGRQERKSAPRTPISAKLVSDILQTSGVSRVLAFELHNSAIQGFFNIPVDHLYVRPIFQRHFSHLDGSWVVVSPDAGGVERARALAKTVGCDLAIIDKRRERPNESKVMNVIGQVAEKNCLIVDDIVDTGGSLINAANSLLLAGACSVSAAISHPVLSKDAAEKIESSEIREMVVTDSIPVDNILKLKKIKQVSIAELMARAISRIHQNESISSLFL